MSRGVDDQMKAFELTLESENEGPSFTFTSEPAHLTARSPHDLLASAECRTIGLLMTKEKAECIYAGRVTVSTTRAAG